MLPGNRPIYALLYARLAESWRRAGNLQQAGSEALDGAANAPSASARITLSTAVLAMEMAETRSRQRSSLCAAEVLRALEILARARPPRSFNGA